MVENRKVQIPTLGQIVLYWGELGNKPRQHPAIVTRVWSGEEEYGINLWVFFDCRTATTRSAVFHKDTSEELEYWDWIENAAVERK